MIYEDERTVDELVDEILGAGDGVRAGDTEAAADGRTTQRRYLNRCKDCGQTFETPYVGGKYCPACKRKRISEGQKARQARERQERDTSSVGAAIGRQNPDRPEENETHLYPSDELQAKWEALKEAEDTSSAPPKREPPAPEPAPRRAQDVLLDLYSTVRSIATAAVLDPSRTIEALWEIDNILGAVGRA